MWNQKLPRGDDLTARILSFLAADDKRLSRFLEVSGLTVAAMRHAAGSPALADALLEHILEDDVRTFAFASYCEVSPDEVMALRRRLRLVPRTSYTRA